MSAPLHIEETTIRDMSVVVFGKHQHTKLARSAIEFLTEEFHANVDAKIDLATLRQFVGYLIKEKGYN